LDIGRVQTTRCGIATETSTKMYNAHRGMVPTAPSSRLTELLDQVRQEFDAERARASADFEQQSKFDTQLLLQISLWVFAWLQCLLRLAANYLWVACSLVTET